MQFNNDDGIRLSCNLCKYPRVSQELWLKTVSGRDYLVCKRHLNPDQRRKLKNEHKKSNA